MKAASQFRRSSQTSKTRLMKTKKRIVELEKEAKNSKWIISSLRNTIDDYQKHYMRIPLVEINPLSFDLIPVWCAVYVGRNEFCRTSHQITRHELQHNSGQSIIPIMASSLLRDASETVRKWKVGETPGLDEAIRKAVQYL